MPSELVRGIDVAGAVADEEGPPQPQPELPGGPDEELHARLAALAGRAVAGGMGAVVDGVEAGARPGEEVGEPDLDRLEIRLGEEAASDPRLVGHEHDRNARAVETRDRLAGRREELDALRLRQVVAVVDDRAVAVQKDGRDGTLPSPRGYPMML